jgi:hypothetical protein
MRLYSGFEPSLGDLIQEMILAGHLRAASQADEAVAATEVSVVCVGAPSLKGVCRRGFAFRNMDGRENVLIAYQGLGWPTASA